MCMYVLASLQFTIKNNTIEDKIILIFFCNSTQINIWSVIEVYDSFMDIYSSNSLLDHPYNLTRTLVAV